MPGPPVPVQLYNRDGTVAYFLRVAEHLDPPDGAGTEGACAGGSTTIAGSVVAHGARWGWSAGNAGECCFTTSARLPSSANSSALNEARIWANTDSSSRWK